MSVMTTYESTARTLLNMHLVALHRQGKALALADTTKALQFIMGLPTYDTRLSRLLQETHIAIEPLREYLQESLSELCQAESRKLVPMLVPIPPNLEASMGYTGQLRAMFTDTARDARYLGFYWSAGHVYWEDGLGGQTDSWSGYLTWHDHWTVLSSLGHFQDTLGSDDGEIATHEWLLDRKTRLVFIAPQTAAHAVLRSQWPKEAFPDLSVEEAAALLKNRRKPERMPANEEIWQRYQQEMQLVNDLGIWLEKYWSMPIMGGDG